MGGPAWSPDGTRMLFWAMPSMADNVRPDVWIMRASGRDVRRLSVFRTSGSLVRTFTDTNPRIWADSPAWQPAR